MDGYRVEPDDLRTLAARFDGQAEESHALASPLAQLRVDTGRSDSTQMAVNCLQAVIDALDVAARGLAGNAAAVRATMTTYTRSDDEVAGRLSVIDEVLGTRP